jgi:ribosome biogenesis GTPase
VTHLLRSTKALSWKRRCSIGRAVVGEYTEPDIYLIEDDIVIVSSLNIYSLMNNLENLGYSSWLDDKLDPKQAMHEIARVVSVHKESYLISKGGEEVFAELSGNLMYSADSVLDLPTTGDWVYADFFDDDSHAIIYGLMPRRTLLKRKSVGKKVDFQLVAANVDVAFIVQSLNENFNLRRLERYLVMVNAAGIRPVILLSKCDLVSELEMNTLKAEALSIAPDVEVLALSSVSQQNISVLLGALKAGETYCLLGSSGVGKTTLLNCILGDGVFKTGSVSKIESKGRHTTTARQLVQLENGAIILDTPGMRELGAISVDEGLNDTFSDIIEMTQQCRFSNCSHTNEKGCAVLSAIEADELLGARYQSYLKMKKESDFNEMSYLEKKTKDKNFGKMIKSVMKNKQR